MFKPKLKDNTNIKYKIFSVLSQLDIYSNYLEQPIHLGRFLINTLRGEKNPSLQINKVEGGKYLFRDFGDTTYAGDCINLVMLKYGCDYNEALNHIVEDFNLDLNCIKISEKVYQEFPEAKIPNKKKRKSIKFTYKKFDKECREYWEKYHLNESYLRNKDVYQVSKIFIEDNVIKPSTLTIGYYAKDVDNVKIYRPYERGTGKNRFLTNLDFDYLFKDNIHNKNLIIVAKSRKDELVLSALLPNISVTSVQAESIHCFSTSNVSHLTEFERVFINFGSDVQGKNESKIITKNLGFKHINTPDNLLPEVNDFSEMVRVVGMESTLEFIKSKLLIA